MYTNKGTVSQSPVAQSCYFNCSSVYVNSDSTDSDRTVTVSHVTCGQYFTALLPARCV